jgi:hypothetical protein
MQLPPRQRSIRPKRTPPPLPLRLSVVLLSEHTTEASALSSGSGGLSLMRSPSHEPASGE